MDVPNSDPGPGRINNPIIIEFIDLKPPVTPESLRPFPKAGPRIATTKGRKKRKSAVLTDTPVKLELELEEAIRLSKRNKKTQVPKGRRLGKSVKKNLSSTTQEWLCTVCMGEYSKSKPGEEWIKCIKCDDWTHDACASKPSITFCCEKCSA